MNEKIGCDEEFEVNRPHGTGKLYKFLIDYKFKTAEKLLPFTIKGLLLLDSCCGSGMASEYYAREGARVVGIDFSFEAIKRAKLRSKRYGFKALFIVGDSEKLPFKDGFFDIASVHDGLHHLKTPQKGVNDLMRVSRKGVIIIEPARAFLNRVSVLLGISTDYEGEDYVYRFTEEELKGLTKKAGINQTRSKRYIMYYPHYPHWWFRFFGLPFLFQGIVGCFIIFNFLFGWMGNKINFVAIKEG